MNKLKFPTQSQPEFINELREQVKAYFDNRQISKNGNLNLVLKSLFMLGLYMVPYILMLSGIVLWQPLLFACWIIMGIGMAGIGMGLMHDAIHGSYSKNRILNSLIGKSIYLLGGFPLNWQYQHNTLHHGFTNVDGYDEDIAPVKLLRFSPHKPLLRIHKYQYLYAWFFYGLLTLSWSVTKDFIQVYKFKKDKADIYGNKSNSQLYIKLIVSKLLYYAIFLVLPLLIIAAPWYIIVLGYLCMHFTCGLLLSTVFQTAHVVPTSKYPLPDGEGHMNNNWAIHQLMTTSDFAPKSRILSWYIGGLNYQIEHHLFPNICHVHYRRLSLIVKETAMKYSLPYNVQPTFVKAVVNHTKMLRTLGTV